MAKPVVLIDASNAIENCWLAEVSASRERLVRAAEVERKRVERDLHDGAQQQLIREHGIFRGQRGFTERGPARCGERTIR